MIGFSAQISLSTLAKYPWNYQGASVHGAVWGILSRSLCSPVFCLPPQDLVCLHSTDVFGVLSRSLFSCLCWAAVVCDVQGRSLGVRRNVPLTAQSRACPGINRSLSCRAKPEIGCWMQGFHHAHLSHQLQVTGEVLVRHFMCDLGVFFFTFLKSQPRLLFLLT